MAGAGCNDFARRIEQYHEKLEEDYLFPRFRKHNVLVDLANTLEEQHKAGRTVTERIITLARGGLKAKADKEKLATSLHQFVRMYAPHEAREDTVLFPALHSIISRNEYDSLGEESSAKNTRCSVRKDSRGWCQR